MLGASNLTYAEATWTQTLPDWTGAHVRMLRYWLARIVGDNEDHALPDLVRSLMGELREELIELDARIGGYDRKIRELYRNSEICQRLGKVEGIGPVTAATALVAAVGDRSSTSRMGVSQFAGVAWPCAQAAIERWPRQTIRRISGKRGRSLSACTLLIHGARSALGRVRDKQDLEKPVSSAVDAAAASPQHCRRRAREQECADRLELAHQRYRLRSQSSVCAA